MSDFNNWIIIGMLVLFVLFGFEDSQTLEASRFEILQSEGLIAYYMEYPSKEINIDNTIEDCPCKGTKKISRDGRIFTDCDCIVQNGTCDCFEEQNQVPTQTVEFVEEKLVAYGATWCPPCKKVKPYYEELWENGWTKEKLEYVDTDKFPNGKYGYKPKGIPSIVKVINNKAILSTAINPLVLLSKNKDGSTNWAEFNKHFSLKEQNE